MNEQTMHKVKDFTGKEYEFNSVALLSNNSGSVDFKDDFLRLTIKITAAMKKAGIKKISETSKGIITDLELGEILETTANGSHSLKIKLADKPELKALAENYFQIKTDQKNYKNKIAEAARQKSTAADNALVAKMTADYLKLKEQIPPGMLEVEFKEAGSFDGEMQYDASVNGVKLHFSDYTSLGWATATRPGAMAAFQAKQVAYISPEKLAEIKTQSEARQKQAYQDNKAAFDKVAKGRDKEALLEEMRVEAGKIKAYDAINNEGYGDGYNPHKARLDELEWALSKYDKYYEVSSLEVSK